MLDNKALRLANAVDALLDWHLRKGCGHRVLYRHQQTTITYDEFAVLTRKAANLFALAGIEPDNRVVLILPDSPVLAAAVLGLMRMGAVPVPLSGRLTVEEYAAILADCRPKGLVLAEHLIAPFEHVRDSCVSAHLPWPKAVWVADTERQEQYPQFSSELVKADNECATYSTSGDSIALIQYTSGSTGQPKGVVHLHRAVIAASGPITERLGLAESDLIWSAPKMSFGYGFGNSILFPLSLGASAVLYGGLVDPLTAANILKEYKPSVFFAVPSLYAGLMNLPESRADVDVSSVRRCVSAGEHLSVELAGRWERRFGIPIVDAIGATECLHIFMAGESGRLKGGSVGTPLTGCQARLTNESGNPVAPLEIGELQVRGPFIASCYWRNHDKTAETMVGPWVRTHDLFYQDEQGDYFHVGRTDDVIKVGGLKVAPREIEDCLLRHPSVAECCAVAVPVPQEERTQIIVYVRLSADVSATQSTQRQLRRHASLHLAPHKRPEHIEFVLELPMTSTGKVARYRLREVTTLSLKPVPVE